MMDGMTFLVAAIAAWSTWAGLMVREDIAQGAIDAVARRWPPSGVGFSTSRPITGRLARLLADGRARIDHEAAEVVVIDGYSAAKVLVCPACAAWWTALVAALIAAVITRDLAPLVAPPLSFAAAKLVSS